MAYSTEMKILCGRASLQFAERVCSHLGVRKGESLVDSFSDGETRVQIGENIRGKDVFIINSTCPPVNDRLMELLILIDTAKRASAARVTAVLPYFGYSRQDRKDKPRVPITAKLVSNLIVAAGADRVLTMDLHCDQLQGFFDIPVDHLSSEVAFVKLFQERWNIDKLVVVAPDTGSVHRIRDFAGRLDAPLAIVDKRRPKANVSEVMNLIGDVSGREAVIFDDIIDTGGTLVKAAAAIKKRGALHVTACSTHAVFSGEAVKRICDSVLEEVWVSDTIPLSDEAASCPKVKVLSVAPLMGEAIRRIHEEESISILFG